MSDFEKAFNQLSKVGLENHTELWGEPKTERAFFEAGQASKQAEIDGLKTQLNNMEQCYIKVKKELEDQQKRIDDVEAECKDWHRSSGSGLAVRILEVLRGES